MQKQTKKKTYIVLFTLLVFVSTGAALRWSKGEKTEFTWKTATVEKGDVQRAVEATGTLSAVTTVQVGTQVSGTISKISVDYNSQVEKGQEIALLDTTMLQASVNDAQSNLVRAQAQAREAERSFVRYQKLMQEGLVSQSEYDQMTAEREVAQTAVSSAKSQLERARINLQYATITSPISGVVISRSVDVGQTVAASFNTPTLFTIAQDLTKMQLQASVDQADIGEIKVGQPATFTVDAFPRESFEGEVSQVRLEPVTVQNVVNYTVIIQVPNREKKLMPGMTANLKIITQASNDVLRVPTSAIRFTPPTEYFEKRKEQEDDRRPAQNDRRRTFDLNPGSQARIWTKAGEQLKPVRVQTGISDGMFTELRSSEIEPGLTVVTGYQSPDAENVTQTAAPFGMQRGARGGRR